MLVQPSSAPAERVFSLLENSFSQRQNSALEDYFTFCNAILLILLCVGLSYTSSVMRSMVDFPTCGTFIHYIPGRQGLDISKCSGQLQV